MAVVCLAPGQQQQAVAKGSISMEAADVAAVCQVGCTPGA
jgi:hypothetical protein